MIQIRWLESIPVRWRLALFLSAAAGINYGDRSAFGSVIPPLRQDVGATDVEIGLMGSLFLWSYALASPLAGNAADRFARRLVVVASLATWSGIMLLTGLAHSVSTLYLLRTLLGLAECFYLPAAGALIADFHGRETRGRAVGLHVFGLNLGVLAGGAAAGLLAQHYSWRAAFCALGGCGLGLAVISPWFLPAAGQPPLEMRPAIKHQVARRAYRYLVHVPTFYIMLFATIAASVASWIFLTWLPVYFNETHSLGLAAASTMSGSLYTLPTLGGIVAGGWLSDKLAAKNPANRMMLKCLSFLVSAPLLLLFVEIPTIAATAAILAASAAIRAAGMPSEHPIIFDIVPPEFRSTAIGLLNTCGAGAGGLGVLLAGVLKKTYGLNAVFAGSSVLFMIAGLLALLGYFLFFSRDAARATNAAAVVPALVPA